MRVRQSEAWRQMTSAINLLPMCSLMLRVFLSDTLFSVVYSYLNVLGTCQFAVNGEAVDREAVDREAVNGEAVDREAVNGEAVNGEAVDSEAVDREAVGSEANAANQTQ